MTCTDARLMLMFRRPGGTDLLPTDAADLDRHLAGCPDCSRRAAGESAFDAAMARAVTDVPIPSGLKASLHTAAAKSISRTWWRWAGRRAALAAAFLAAVGLGLSIYAANRPSLDLEGLAIHADDREAAAKKWLSDNRLPTALPYDFDFSLCTQFGYGDVQGQSVPVLHFQDPKNPLGSARVFLVSDGTFNWKIVPEQAGSSYHTALKVPGGNLAPGYTFVILHTGDLARFLRAVPGPG